MGAAARLLNKNIAENDPLLKKLGISATDANGAMVQLADVFGRIPDGAQKTAIAMELMGKSGADMIPLLNGGGVALEEMIRQGQRLNPITAEMARNADQFNDSLAVFKVQAQGAGISIANSLLPAMNDMLARFNDAITLSSQHGGFVSLILGGVNPTGDNAANLANVRQEIAAVNLQLKDADTAQGKAAGLDSTRLKTRLAQLQGIKKTLLEIQQREALALGAPFADYKQAKAPQKGLPKDLLATGSGKTTAPKLDTIDPFGKERTAAELAARNEINKRANEEAADEFRLFSGPAFEAETRALDDYKSRLDALVSNTTLVQTEKLQSDIDFLNTAFFEGAIGAQQYEEALSGLTGKASDEINKVKSEFDLFAEEAVKNFQSGLSDFLFDPFADGLDGMLKGFGSMLQRMAADAIAADITRALFGNASSAGGGGQNILGGIAELFGFANGGAFTVGGGGGTDSQLVAFKATPGEDVTIRTPAQQRQGGSGGQIINMTVVAQDAASFQKSRGQIQADLAFAVAGARRFS